MPLWFCIDCDGIAYGWASGRPCMYCGSDRVLSTIPTDESRPELAAYRLIHLTEERWSGVARESLETDRSPEEVIGEWEASEQVDVVRIQDEALNGGKLILLASSREAECRPA